MNKQEVMEYLENELKNHRKVIEHLKFRRDHSGYPSEEQALTLAISALEKQVPKKLIVSIQPEDVRIGNMTFRKGTEVRCCPSCKCIISSDRYCRSCGQKLNWSVGE